MKKDIKNYVVECHVCQQNKVETISPLGLVQPLPIPQRVWTYISMDFIVGLPLCKGKSVILAVVDRLSKCAHFIAMSHPYTTIIVAHVFIDNVNYMACQVQWLVIEILSLSVPFGENCSNYKVQNCV